MDIQIVTAPTVTKLGPEHVDQVLIAGSHGGVYAGYLAAKAGARAIILNDAGGGLDGAGFASLPYLDDLGRPGATVAHDSARIGDGDDMAARGIISHVNETAAALGCAVGQTATACAEAMRAAPSPSGEAPAYEEARFLFSAEGESPAIWGIDSASLLNPDDVGQIVLTASHGALLGGEAASAIKYDVLACAFNDAGVGIENIGFSRLPALDQRKIAAVTVACQTARIGDARSMWQTGIVSHVNQTAAALGVAVGDSLQEFAKKAQSGES
ncbi:MAG: hypothetical protein HOA08_08225 [Rhodospirillaceae bacterium]|jgi:hypothetical protein|nr:hypothetical protein [Rhodospirillaceae bacterium]MBT3493494.1 hypothetical protein [Rhodospirillaceae bacterium]MBT3779008.1 hypothetical protein [Rhodospirillaceae bacterium]MBT3976833.1 hypothetical protein [Rhodospirillaceae bacterium]MBT4565342.1 hypothetical protein [Rhodospirillaceae bacterium]